MGEPDIIPLNFKKAIIEPEKVIAPTAAPIDNSIRLDNLISLTFPKLKAIVRYGVGFDKIDVNAAKEKNLLVCNTPDYAMSEVSDTALAMLLSITRGINIYDNVFLNIGLIQNLSNNNYDGLLTLNFNI